MTIDAAAQIEAEMEEVSVGPDFETKPHSVHTQTDKAVFQKLK